MVDYEQKVKSFLEKHFTPPNNQQGVPENALVVTNAELINMLSNVFPANALTDFMITEILDQLGYHRNFIQDQFCWILQSK